MPRFFVEKDPVRLKPHLSEFIALSNGEKEALGFLPNSAYEDAILQKRLIAMLAEDAEGSAQVVGYILHGGVFPHARVQQVCTKPEYRRQKVASALIDALISDLEKKSFLTVKAKVASDLPYAQAFYGNHGFEVSSTTPGGRARGRDIVSRVRDLDTLHLFSHDPNSISLGLPKRFGSEAQFYTFDLNVFFDLVKDRKRHSAACVLFGAALDHRIRLGIAPEFVAELRRTSTGQNDPVLQMALQLPRLPPPVDAKALDILAIEIHDIIFSSGVAGAGSDQALSDARHLAHSALSRVTGFITSDSALLKARDQLLERVGIDVAGLEELIALLPDERDEVSPDTHRGQGFECREPTVEEAKQYLAQNGVSEAVIGQFAGGERIRRSVWRLSIWEDGYLVALACLDQPGSVDGENALLVSVQPGHLDRDLYSDYLLSTSVKQACSIGPATVRLINLPGQPSVTAAAKVNGFLSTGAGKDLLKVSIGQPLTPSSWDKLRNQARRKTGLILPATWPHIDANNRDISIVSGSGASFVLTPERIEDMFGPALYLWPSREGVIVPIQKVYAEELLGTAPPRLAFMTDRDASFLSRRAYVNTPRARANMRPGLPILFYESGKNKGRAAVIAAGRIVDSVLVPKTGVSKDEARRLVVDDLSKLSASKDVLMTTFDNLMIFPRPVPFADLKKIGAAGASNLISATSVSHQLLVQIVEAGWRQ